MRATRLMHLSGVLLAVGMAHVPAAEADDAAAIGRLTGVVKYTGKVPAAQPVKVTKDTAICGKEPIYDEALLVGKKGGLANVVVIVEGVKSGGKATGAPAAAVLQQEGCRYTPHVQVVAPGATLTMKNADSTLHTVHAYHDGATLFNDVTATSGSQATENLDDPGPISFKCDAGHTWMSAWIYVVDQPYYAVTDPDGAFAIDGLPPGTYTVRTWHERRGVRTQQVTIAGGKTARVNVRYK